MEIESEDESTVSDLLKKPALPKLMLKTLPKDETS